MALRDNDKGARPTVLVTGVGGPLGVSIVKSLNQSALSPRIVGCDADPVSVGLFRVDAGYTMPRARDDTAGYRNRLAEICAREHVSLVFLGSETEMQVMAPVKRRFEAETDTVLALNDERWIDIFTDKWKTFETLQGACFGVPDSVLPDDEPALRRFLERHAFPLIIKPRFGSGSTRLFTVHSDRELECLRLYIDRPVLQEYLLPDDQEYTAGIYKSRSRDFIETIVFKRSLGAGLTYKAEVVFDNEIAKVCRRLAESFDIWGPFNVQLRRTETGIKIFEVNLRPSSSVAMRTFFGFNELDLCLRDTLLTEELPRPSIRAGTALRYWDEIYLADRTVAEVRQHGEIHSQNGHRFGKKIDGF